MHPKRLGTAFQSLLVIICIVGILPGDTLAYMPPLQQAATPTSVSQTQSAKIPPDQLYSLVAPSGAEPYHGYFFKILRGQGPAAPLGDMDYVVKG